MTASLDLPTLRTLRERLAPPRRDRPDWPRGVRALRALLDDPDSTQHALEVTYALDGDVVKRRLGRFLAHPEGRRLYDARPSLLERVGDSAWLRALPAESFGRAYLDHMERNGFDARKLVELRRRHDPVRERDPGETWFAERTDLLHDLWHTLSGYGGDGAGEAALLPFTLAQLGGRSNLLLTTGAGLEIWRRRGDTAWPRTLWRAWRRGRRAALLDVLAYEELLPLPLEDVRAAVGIEPPERAHPEGLMASEDAA